MAGILAGTKSKHFHSGLADGTGIPVILAGTGYGAHACRTRPSYLATFCQAPPTARGCVQRANRVCAHGFRPHALSFTDIQGQPMMWQHRIGEMSLTQSLFSFFLF
jgi:hypothetical protein